MRDRGDNERENRTKINKKETKLKRKKMNKELEQNGLRKYGTFKQQEEKNDDTNGCIVTRKVEKLQSFF